MDVDGVAAERHHILEAPSVLQIPKRQHVFPDHAARLPRADLRRGVEQGAIREFRQVGAKEADQRRGLLSPLDLGFGEVVHVGAVALKDAPRVDTPHTRLQRARAAAMPEGPPPTTTTCFAAATPRERA